MTMTNKFIVLLLVCSAILLTIEVKTGNSPYKKSQQIKDLAIGTEGGTAVGRKAENAGISGPVQFATKLERYDMLP